MMVDAMKWIVPLLCSFPLLAGLADVKAVYLLPMANGLDQYLANHLAKAGIYQVVTDPKRADAVFSDRVGDTLESQLKELYAEPKPEAEKKKEPPEAGAASGDVAAYSGAPKRATSFGGGKGNLFLVDVKSRTVVWSTHARPKHIAPEQLDAIAKQIVESLNLALHPKQK
jgi:hypothetical protein